MSKLRKLMAVIISVVMMVSLFVVPSFAESMGDAEICEMLNVLKGTGEGLTPEYLGSTPMRYQAAIMFLRLQGLEDEALAWEGTANFTDVEAMADWEFAPSNKAVTAYLYANPDLGFVGYTDGTFRPLQPITATEYYKVMLTAMGYEQDKDFEWAEVLDFAASLGLSEVADVEEFTVMHLATATVEALKGEVKDGDGMTLIEKLVADGVIDEDVAIATEIYEKPSFDLAVVDVTANNLKTVRLDFNKAVKGFNKDKTEAQINGKKAADTEFKLTDDGTTLVVIFKDKFAQADMVKIILKDVEPKDGVGEVLADYSWEKRVYDQAYPEMLGAAALNSKQLQFFFSEPVDLSAEDAYQVWNDIKINEVPIIARVVEVDHVDCYAIFQVSTKLPEKAFDLEVKGIEDFAGFPMYAVEYEGLEVPVDKDAPYMTKAEVISVDLIKVFFNERVEIGGEFKVNDELIDPDDVNWADDKKSALLTLAEDLDLSALIEVTVEYRNQADFEGNVVKDWTKYKFNIEDDTSAPTVKSASLDSKDNKLIIEFSKSMMPDVGKIEIFWGGKSQKTIKDGALTGFFNDERTKLTIPAADTGLAGKDSMEITVVISDMKDNTVRHNLLTKAEYTFVTKDLKLPEVVEGGFYYDGDKKATIYFSESMNADTLKALGNYAFDKDGEGDFDPVAFVDKAKVASIGADNKSVTLEIPGLNGNSVIKVYAGGLKDLAGNGISEYILKKIQDTDLSIEDIYAKALDKVTVKFSHNIYFCDPSVIKVEIKKEAGKYEPYAVPIKAEIKDDEVTFTLNRELETGLSAFRVALNNYNLVQNLFGVMLDEEYNVPNSGKIGDKIAPAVDKVEAKAGTSDITITFTEALNETVGVDKGRFVVRYDGKAADVTHVKVDGDTVTVTVYVYGGFAANKKVSIWYYASAVASQNLQDENKNEVADFDKTVDVKK